MTYNKKITNAFFALTLLFSSPSFAQENKFPLNFTVIKNVEIWFVVAFFLVFLFIIHSILSKGNKHNRQLFEERQEKKLQRQEEEDYFKNR